MKLLVVGGQWPPETFIQRRLQGLAQVGFDVTVVTNRNESRNASVDGITWIPVPVWEGAALQRAGEIARMLVAGFLQAPAKTWRILRISHAEAGAGKLRMLHQLLPFASLRPDFLHFEWNFAAVRGLPLIDLLGCPTVVSCRGAHVQIAPHNPERQVEASQLPLTFHKASAIHCVSQAIREEAIALGAPPSKTHIIRPAVDPNLFRPAEPRQRRDGRFRIVMTGSLIWRKGYEYALSALRKLLDRGVNATLVLIGSADKENRQRLLYTIHDLDLLAHVELPGNLPPGDVVKALQKADAFLLASVSEGISNAVLEAMSCGIPVVTTDCGGMREAVTDGVEGFLVPVRSARKMADALETLANEPALRARMGDAARARIVQDFQLRDQIRNWVSLYSRLLEKPDAFRLTHGDCQVSPVIGIDGARLTPGGEVQPLSASTAGRPGRS